MGRRARPFPSRVAGHAQRSSQDGADSRDQEWCRVGSGVNCKRRTATTATADRCIGSGSRDERLNRDNHRRHRQHHHCSCPRPGLHAPSSLSQREALQERWPASTEWLNWKVPGEYLESTGRVPGKYRVAPTTPACRNARARHTARARTTARKRRRPRSCSAQLPTST